MNRRLILAGPVALTALVLCTAGKSAPDHSMHDKTSAVGKQTRATAIAAHSQAPSPCPPSGPTPSKPGSHTSAGSASPPVGVSPPTPSPAPVASTPVGSGSPVVAIVPPPAQAPPTGGIGSGVAVSQPSELALTGDRTEQESGIGGLLLGAGVALLVVARRRGARS